MQWCGVSGEQTRAYSAIQSRVQTTTELTVDTICHLTSPHIPTLLEARGVQMTLQTDEMATLHSKRSKTVVRRMSGMYKGNSCKFDLEIVVRMSNLYFKSDSCPIM